MVSVASFDARYLKQLPVGQLVKDTLEMLQGDRRVFTRVELEAALMARGYMRHQMPLDELWQLLDQAAANGQQTEATYVLLLDAYLVDEFLVYREDNLDKLTDYVLSLVR